jgi:hypothetical protein
LSGKAKKGCWVYEVAMQQRPDIYTLPEDLPVVLPSIPLSSTDGEQIDLAALPGQTVASVKWLNGSICRSRF